jgi:integrase
MRLPDVGIQIVMDTGTRPQEVGALRIQNIDFERGYIFVISGKTRKARRHLPISDRVREVHTGVNYHTATLLNNGTVFHH